MHTYVYLFVIPLGLGLGRRHAYTEGFPCGRETRDFGEKPSLDISNLVLALIM